ncbi:FAD-dependent oxidoreductase [Lacticaseibacillus saniviri]
MANTLNTIFKATPLTVADIQNPAADYYIIKLNYATDRHFDWKPGTAGLFTLPHQKNTGSGFRFFSIAGVPDEHAITIGTRTGKTASAYKAVLTHLHKGDRVNLRGPIGSFGVKNDSAPVVMIASGVGVTPFRAMALDLTADQTRPIKLIQSAHGFHLFQSDFEAVAQKNARFEYLPVESGKDAQAQMLATIKELGDSAYYYLSGASKIVKANKQFLKQHGVPARQIITDVQFGY